MPEKRVVTVYIDYKSPYAYLAKDLVSPARGRARSTGYRAPPRQPGSSVPSFVVDGEQFWGSEHLPDIRQMLASNPTHSQRGIR